MSRISTFRQRPPRIRRIVVKDPLGSADPGVVETSAPRGRYASKDALIEPQETQAMSTTFRSPLCRNLAMVAIAALLVASTSALAADVSKEVATAAEHAGYAAEATLLTTTQAHLHHTVNCLVGPKGKGFDAKELNPCKGLGNGAIPDSTDAAKKKLLEQALASADAGLASKDLAAAKKAAAEAEAALKSAM